MGALIVVCFEKQINKCYSQNLIDVLAVPTIAAGRIDTNGNGGEQFRSTPGAKHVLGILRASQYKPLFAAIARHQS